MKKSRSSGFTLVQLSVMLMIASLVMVSILPTTQKNLDANRITTERMNELMKYFRAYMAANGSLPCPADATTAIGASTYGTAAANSGATNNCSGSSPAANMVDSTNHIAMGMVPVKTLGLPKEYALDGYGRYISYAVDTNVTGSCWSSPATGTIIVSDNGSAAYTVMALVSHGANGHGAWIPLNGSSGTGQRFNNNSSNPNELTNAHVDAGFLPQTNLSSFVKDVSSTTFDDVVIYSSPSFSVNARPTVSTGINGTTISSITTPASGYYYYRELPRKHVSNTISFTVTFGAAVTVDTTGGTPRIALTATSVGGGAVSLTGNGGSGGTAYANYFDGTGTTDLIFNYPIQSDDMAPNGLTIAATVDENGGSIASTCNLNFTAPTLTDVIIPKVIAITSTGTWTVPVDYNNTTNEIYAVGSGGNGYQGTATEGGGGGGGGAHAYGAYTGTPGDTPAVQIGAAGGTDVTFFEFTSTVAADYGRNASSRTGAIGGLASNSYPSTSASDGGSGGNGNATSQGGGGGGAGAAGPTGPAGLNPAPGKNGGAGGGNGGGGGGGGGSNGGTSSGGLVGLSNGGNGGNGGRGYNGSLLVNKGLAGGVAASAGLADKGGGGGGGGGSNAASTDSGAGGAGSISVTNVSDYISWTTNIAPIGNYGVGGGGGGSGGAKGTTSNSGVGGAGGGYGAGGGGSGGATGTPGLAGTGTQGLVIITYR